MYREIEYDSELVEEYILTQTWDQLINYLSKQFTINKDETGAPIKFAFSKEPLDSLLQIVTNLENLLHNEDKKIQIQTEVFKAFRNCACSEEAQDYLAKDVVLNAALIKVQLANNEQTKFILQFLINLIVSNKTTSQKVYEKFITEIRIFLHEKRFLKETFAMLYNLSMYNDVYDSNLIKSVLECISHDDCSPWINFLMEKYVKNNLIWTLYETVDVNGRIFILETARSVNDEKESLPKEAVEVLIKKFLQSPDIILQAMSLSDTNCEPYECSLILELISSLSSKEHLNFMQQDKSLLINASALLLNVHRLGKSANNCFSAVPKLAQLKTPSEDIRKHPAFSFKADLVRLIGNLCWKCEVLQNLAREAEVIPVLLDCCNIDARNPFIIQWVILAVRNLCESNPENQKFIASLHQEGTVDSNVLNEMGLTLHSDGENSLNIVPLESLRK